MICSNVNTILLDDRTGQVDAKACVLTVCFRQPLLRMVDKPDRCFPCIFSKLRLEVVGGRFDLTKQCDTLQGIFSYFFLMAHQ